MELLLAIALAVTAILATLAWNSREIERARAWRLADELASLRKHAPAPLPSEEAPLLALEPEPAPRGMTGGVEPVSCAPAPRSQPVEPLECRHARLLAGLEGPEQRLADTLARLDALLESTAPKAPVQEKVQEEPPITIGEMPPQSGEGVSSAIRAAEQIEDERSRLADDVRSLRQSFERTGGSAHAASGSLAAASREAEFFLPLSATLSGLADRINLLALNVTLLATRAGEAGVPFEQPGLEMRGLFEETRRLSRDLASLSQKTAASAGRSAELLETAASAAASGRTRADNAAQRVGALSVPSSRLAASLETALHELRAATDHGNRLSSELGRAAALLEARRGADRERQAEVECLREDVKKLHENLLRVRDEGHDLLAPLTRISEIEREAACVESVP